MNNYSFQQVAEYHSLFHVLMVNEYKRKAKSVTVSDFKEELSLCKKQVQFIVEQKKVGPDYIKKLCRTLFNLGVARLVLEQQVTNPVISEAFVTGFIEQKKASTLSEMYKQLRELQVLNQFSLANSDCQALFHFLGKVVGAIMEMEELGE